MHFIQKNIINRLRTDGECHYADLMPDDIESSHFRYHLLQLVKAGIVEQKSRGVYALTPSGLLEVDYMSESHLPQRMPKVITYTLLSSNDTYYLHKKTKEPYKGLLNFVGGKVHVGETANQASRREVAEKTELLIEPPKFVGTAEILIYNKQTLTSHTIAEVFVHVVSDESELKDHSTLIAVLKNDIAPNLVAPDFLPLITEIEKSEYPFHVTLELGTSL